MKGEDLLRGLSELDEKWIEEASAPVKRKKKPPVFYYRILAACAVYLIVGSAVFFAWQHDSGQERMQLYQESEEPAVPEATETADRSEEPVDSTGEQPGIGTVAPFGTGNPPAVPGAAAPQPAQRPHSNTAVRPSSGQNGEGSVYEDSHINKSDIFHSIHDVQGAEGWGFAPNGANDGTNNRPGGNSSGTSNRPDGDNSGISRPSSSDPGGNPGLSTPKPPAPEETNPQASQNPPKPVKTQPPKPTAKPTLAPKPTQAPKPPSTPRPTQPPRTPEPSKTPEPQAPPPTPTPSEGVEPTSWPSWTWEPPPWDPTDSEMPVPTDHPWETDEPVGEQYSYGDLNGDKKIDSEDAMLVLHHIQNTAPLSQEQLKYADVDGDGEVTMEDYSLILQMAAGMIDRFPVQDQRNGEMLNDAVLPQNKRSGFW